MSKDFDKQLDKLHKDKYVVDSLGTVDSSAVFSPGTPAQDMYWGHGGNSPDNYNLNVNSHEGIELGLNIHYRNGAYVAPSGPRDADGAEHYAVSAGTQPGAPTYSAWNFDFVVATGLGHKPQDLSDYTFKIVIGQGSNVHTFEFDAATHIWLDAATGVGFAGDDFAHAASADVQANVAENSVNLKFLTGDFGNVASATAAGTVYDIAIEAFKGPNLVGYVHDVITLV